MILRPFSGPAVNALQRGLTLVEVMVAMTIGIILLLAMGSLLVNSTRVFKVSDDFARMQENGAYALNSIGSDLRMAGFYGATTTNDIEPRTAVGEECGAGWATNFAQPLLGLPLSGDPALTSAAAHAAMPCINASNFVSSAADRPTFILVVRGASGVQVAPANLDDNTLYVQTDPNGGMLFKGDQYKDFPTPPRRTVLGGAEAPIYAYQAKAYYLRPCSRPKGGPPDDTVCLATDDGNQPIPTLVRQELLGAAMTEVAVAEGIEAMRISYGIDTHAPPDGTPAKYTETPTLAEFAQVVAARVSLLVRSPKPTAGYDDSSRRYDLDGDGNAELGCADAPDLLPCNYHRHVFTQSFQVRNIAQRLESQP